MNPTHLGGELLAGDVGQEAGGVHIHSVATGGLNNGHAAGAQVGGQQLDLAVRVVCVTACVV